jgi:hypothetical protein
MTIENQARSLQRRQQLRQSHRQLSVLTRTSSEIKDFNRNHQAQSPENLNLN